MRGNKIEQLEKIIVSTRETLSGLHAEKKILQERVLELEKENKVALKEKVETEDLLDRLKELKVSHQKLEKDRSAVRQKVQGALQKIEKMDFF